jgi:DNA invertase Pin-like site-specific DNA recombinase
MPKAKPKSISYLRVSTDQQDTAKNKADVLAFANDRHFGHVEFVEEVVSGRKSWQERKIASIIDDLVKGDRLIVPELTRLGRSTLEVLEILKAAKEKEVAIYSVKERMELNGDDIQSKITATMLSLFAELEHDFISMRTKEALKARKAAGVKLGRPKGPGKSKLDAHKDEIIALLKTGVPKTKVAERYKAHRTLLHNWLKKNKISL